MVYQEPDMRLFFVSQYCDQFGLINAGSYARKGD
ncbi:hypothetical protein VCG_003123 [Vibrio cholerae 12129(1)]|nr:hypothetical protein VCG_003123 [Vibrio cholerae 12129(1)]EEO04096.1 hypothetical protein VCA_003128 [Vibrio cholerae VL426]